MNPKPISLLKSRLSGIGILNFFLLAVAQNGQAQAPNLPVNPAAAPAKPSITSPSDAPQTRREAAPNAAPRLEPRSEPRGDDTNKNDSPNGATNHPRTSVTKHSLTINGQKLDYTATAGVLPLRDNAGKPTAEIFFIAYTKDGADAAKRPITFSFNGGPGSASVWMHLGLLGPKRVKLGPDGGALPPPYELLDNEYSLLDESDLVFIDPVGTGYSRAVAPADSSQFFGLREDVRSIADFIRLYVTQNARWLSPKFLIGESYGTMRAAALSEELSSRHYMNINGIMLVSTILNFQTISNNEGNDLPHVLYLPSFTSAAWAFKKLPPDLQKLPLSDVLKQAEAFALGDYSQALMQGAALSPEKRASVLRQMARLTGLSENYLDRADLRPTLSRFSVELLRDRDLQIGRYDSRYSGPVRDRLTETSEGDPSFDAVQSVFASTFNDYVRSDLKYEEDQPYKVLSSVQPWNWGANNEFVNVTDNLARALTANPFLKVHVSCGYSDLATPYFAARYTINHLGVAPELMKNITLDYYSAGHMMYLNPPDLQKQKADLSRFIRSAYAH